MHFYLDMLFIFLGKRLKNTFKYISVIFLFIIFQGNNLLSKQENCSVIFSTPIEHLEWSSDDIEIIFFPSAHHTKLRVGDFIYGNECPGNRCTESSLRKMDWLGSLGSGVQFRFKIKISKSEFQEIQNYIEQGKFGSWFDLTCTHSACKAVTKNSQTWIPAPFNLLPTTNALFLLTSVAIPNSRVESFRIYKPRNVKWLHNARKSIMSGLEGILFPTVIVSESGRAISGIIEILTKL